MHHEETSPPIIELPRRGHQTYKTLVAHQNIRLAVTFHFNLNISRIRAYISFHSGEL
jgi:hypothetical protein